MIQKHLYARLSAALEGHKQVVLVTLEADGSLRTCRIESPFVDERGTLWLFTDSDAPQVSHVERNPELCIYCGDASDCEALSISGTGFVITNVSLQQKVRSIRDATQLEHHDSNKMALIKVTVDYLEYWDGDNNRQARYSKQTFTMVDNTTSYIGEQRSEA